MTAPSSLAGTSTLVTGGAGFIGSHLVEALLAAGARVRVLDDLSSGRRENLAAVAERIELVLGDVRDPAACVRACAGVELVFHLAAATSVPRSMAEPAETIAINVGGTVNVLAAARAAGVRRAIVASSSAVYGDATAVPAREGGEGRPLSPYALSKRQAEAIAELYARELGLATLCLRFFNVYGPRQDPAGPYAAVVPLFFAACVAGEAPQIFGDGEQTRDFVYVADVVEALLAAARGPQAPGEALNVASGEAITIRELAAAVRRGVGAGQEPVSAPARAGEVRHSCGDPTRAERLLGFRARTSLAEGLRASRSYFIELARHAPAVGDPSLRSG